MTRQTGYCVKISIFTYDRTSGAAITEAEEFECYVQPPAYCRDDPAVLELQLQLAAKLKYVYYLRHLLKTNKTPEALVDKDWSVRGRVLSYHFHEQ